MKGVPFSQVEARVLDVKWQRVGVAKGHSCSLVEAPAAPRCRKVAAFQMQRPSRGALPREPSLLPPSGPVSLCFEPFAIRPRVSLLS